jgi:hypothetical protein
MINFRIPNPITGGLSLGILTLILMVSPPLISTAEAAAPKYKKSTVVDFEGALVEGKSRKPYSAYLTQQKDSAFGELHQWQPDLDKSLLDSQRRLDKSL